MRPSPRAQPQRKVRLPLRRRRYLLAAAACLIFATTTAQAEPNPHEPPPQAQFPSEHVMTDRIALHEVAMGISWWRQHGVTGCPAGVAPKVVADKELKAYLLADATADQRREWGPHFDVYGLSSIEAPHRGGCEMWIARSVYDIYDTQRRFYELNRTCRATSGPGERRYYCTDRVTVEEMRVEQELRCAIERHELGHAIGGLDDDEISPDPDITDTMAQSDMVPMYADCEALARLTWRYSRPKPRARARHHRHWHLVARRVRLR